LHQVCQIIITVINVIIILLVLQYVYYILSTSRAATLLHRRWVPWVCAKITSYRTIAVERRSAQKLHSSIFRW